MDELAVVERLLDATNRHDLEALVACFAEDYELTAPSHPERGFSGNARVRQNWQTIFGAVPDIAVELVSAAVDGEVVWTEQEMRGRRRDGEPHLLRGVFIFRVSEGLIRQGRMYLEPVTEDAPSVLDALRRQAAPS